MSAVNTAVSSQRGDLPTEHRAATGVIVSAIFTFLAIAIVNARFYTRVHIINRVEANDIMVVIALVISTTINPPRLDCPANAHLFSRSSPWFFLDSSLPVWTLSYTSIQSFRHKGGF